jgi:DNA-binding PadR family transcriptional regulator
MRTGTIFKRYELFVAAGVIAAHASSTAPGFRQRDVRFLIELFSNWVETSFEGQVLEVNNTQVLRYLETLVDEGFARQDSRRSRSRPRYRLTRSGLIELLGRLVPQALHIQPEHFFFLYYFLRNYRPLIERLIESEGKRYPLALRYEVQSLLDIDSLVEQQLRYAELELRRLDERIHDSVRGGKLAEKLFAENRSLAEVAEEIEARYPYELNSQQPLTELIAGVPEDLGAWELSTGALRRVEDLWNPSRAMLLTYLECLKKLAAAK